VDALVLTATTATKSDYILFANKIKGKHRKIKTSKMRDVKLRLIL